MAAVDWLRHESAFRRPPAPSSPSPRVSYPQEFICPLSNEVMRDPVIISSGKSFERVYIERWFAQGRATCPKTGLPLAHQMLTPNDALQKLISDWCKSHMITLKPLRPSSPLTSAGDNSRDPSVPPSPASGETFDLAKARAAAAADRAAAGSAGSSAAAAAAGVGSASSRISPQSVLERRHSLQSDRDGGSSTSGSASGGSGPAAVETPKKPATSAASAVSAASNMPPAIPKHLRPNANDGPLERTMSPRRRGDQSPATPCNNSASPKVLSRNRSDPWAASNDEDAKNDEALGSFLAGNVAGARSQRQGSRRGAASPEEVVPYSKQILSSTPTRRSRRTSEQGSVTEMRPLIDALRTGDVAQRREAVHAMRLALKEAPENRTRLVAAGGIRPLMQMLLSTDGPIVEQASAATLYLSLQWDGAMEVVSAGGVRNLVEVVKTSRGGLCLTPRGANVGTPDTSNGLLLSPGPGGAFEATEVAKSNAAAALFALSNAEENKKVVWSAGAVPPLINLLRKATCMRTKKDCCLALYNLALFPKAAEDAIKHGLVRQVFALLEGEEEPGVEEKAAVLLCALAKYPQGIYALKKEEEVEFTLIGVMESGSEKAAELSAGTLLSLAKADGEEAMSEMLGEGCLPPLVKLAGNSKPGSDSRALLAMLREFAQIRSGNSSSVAGSQPGTPMAGSRPTTPLGRGMR
ncbi:hypothetical protein CLOM_g3126 [Closterium sp. NIES-68]|nr:hypothetical protein CLOM_g18260 [Closterium sp. NIES-68]GJP43692.1 hypothetical protein CLOM_g3126 [Closterium sp. NIES-68]GJP63413.1 hypothetical protein CLOP_g20498 [Closterium sp. NIES-67]